MLFRLFGYLFGIGAVAAIAVGLGAFWYVDHVSKDLPDYERLENYAPPVTTRVHAVNGTLLAEYASEPRLFLPIQAIPDRVKQAFISAEDKMFYSHDGINFWALGKVGLNYAKSKLTGGSKRLRGASTITQQVAKNFFLSPERSVKRKVQEALLALRLDRTFSKDKILELYLNKIYLGKFPRRSYGIASAALAYFGKRVQDLTIEEAAYLAALPKAPHNYDPFRYRDRATDRRNWVIGRMHINGYITAEEARAAKAQPIKVNPHRPSALAAGARYFLEEARRRIVQRYGKDQLYEGGLSVRTTLDLKMQGMARRTLSKGLIVYDRKRGWRGPLQQLEETALAEDWGAAVAKVRHLRDVPEWRLAVVLEVNEEKALVGLKPARKLSGRTDEARETVEVEMARNAWAKRVRGEDGVTSAKTFDAVLSRGDVVYVAKETLTPPAPEPVEGEEPKPAPEPITFWALQQVPQVSGALVAMDPHTGRVKALVGGFSFAQSQFNRATQARRQPGSSFKPFVYAAALDNGYTPSSVVIDGPIKINQGATLGIWEPKNYGGKYGGPSTLRVGIEKSRNLMTVRLANDIGMPLIAEYAKRFGIYDKEIRGLASSLGSRETTVLRMVGAYAVLANGGKAIKPSLIDRIQDRYGRTIFRHDERFCRDCNPGRWTGQEEPEVVDNRDQVLDPMTAYQITSMMEGVIMRGTATTVNALGRPVAGKTGTTNDEKDAWFVGYSPDLVVGVFVGFDTPRPMGKGNTGGGLAAPIFTAFMKEALADEPVTDFRVPFGIRLYPINGKTGLLASAGRPGTIMEAFKPGTEPPQRTNVIGFEEELSTGSMVTTDKARRAVQSGTGGLY